MKDEERLPDQKRLWCIAFIAGLIALLGGGLFLNAISDGASLNWVWALMIATLTMIVYSISFYFGVICFENTLEKYIKSDTFKRKHKWIDVETETYAAETKSIDNWVKHYVLARTLFAMGLLPLIASIYLFFIA